MKCSMCKKRVNEILSFQCKCKLKFCSSCRLPEDHECKDLILFSSKALLAKTLIKVEPEKIVKL